MQRLFTMFPAGVPGVGLALLRVGVAVGVTDLMQLATWSGRGLAGAVLAGCLLGGIVTPLFAVLAMALAAWILVASGGGLPVIVVLLDAAALAMIGPGAYSFDARLFGRRVLLHDSASRRS